MEEKKVIAICNSGGVFHKAQDGSLSYSGGNAQAIRIHNKMTFDEFQIELAEMFGRSSIGTMSFKYFIPGYSNTLITISNDKGLRNMIEFHGDSDFIELYVMTDEMLPSDVSNMQQCICRTTVPEAMAPANASLNIVDNAVDDTNATQELIAPVSGFDDNNDVESYIETFPTMPRGDPNDVKLASAAQLWKNSITGVGQTFNSRVEFRESLRKYAIAHQFTFSYKKNDKGRVTVKCKTEGCHWGIHAIPESGELFRIREMTKEHTCHDKAAATTGHQATSSLVARFIEEKLKVSPNYYYKIKDIVSDFKQEHGIQITYQQARRAKMKADGMYQPAQHAKKKAEKGQRKEHRPSPLLGEMIIEEEEHRQTPLLGEMIIEEEEYRQPPLLCEMTIEEIPVSLATFTTKADSTFPGRFFAFRASLSGFEQGCRPLLLLDCVDLPFKSLLLTARTVDGAYNDLPIAFAVVDRETEKKWHHFLLQLKACLTISCPISFVADREWKELISNVFPNSFHAFCAHYLFDELIEEVKKKQISDDVEDVEDEILEFFQDACFASSPKGFHESLERIKGISSETYNCISKIEPKNWATAFFPGERYHYVKSYSDEFRSEIDAVNDELSSDTELVHALGVWTMKEIIERRKESAQWMSRLTPSMEERLEDTKRKAGCLEVSVLHLAGSTYEVSGISNEEVDIHKGNCSCGWWNIFGIPCRHAFAVIHSIDGCPYCSPSPKDFHESLERIKGISSEAYNWISNIKPMYWAIAFFPGERYDCMKAYLDDFMTMEHIFECRKDSAQWMSRLTPSVEELLERHKLEAGCLEVLGSAGSKYKVRDVSNEEVDIDKRNCSCGRWQIHGIPCCHALVVIRSIDGNPYEHCSRYCTTEYFRLTYSFFN